jgi:hypothetical protein
VFDPQQVVNFDQSAKLATASQKTNSHLNRLGVHPTRFRVVEGQSRTLEAQSLIDVIIADHQELFRVGMEVVLASASDIRIVEQAQSGEQLLSTMENVNAHELILSTNFLQAFSTISSRSGCEGGLHCCCSPRMMTVSLMCVAREYMANS